MSNAVIELYFIADKNRDIENRRLDFTWQRLQNSHGTGFKKNLHLMRFSIRYYVMISLENEVNWLKTTVFENSYLGILWGS